MQCFARGEREWQEVTATDGESVCRENKWSSLCECDDVQYGLVCQLINATDSHEFRVVSPVIYRLRKI